MSKGLSDVLLWARGLQPQCPQARQVYVVKKEKSAGRLFTRGIAVLSVTGAKGLLVVDQGRVTLAVDRALTESGFTLHWDAFPWGIWCFRVCLNTTIETGHFPKIFALTTLYHGRDMGCVHCEFNIWSEFVVAVLYMQYIYMQYLLEIIVALWWWHL